MTSPPSTTTSTITGTRNPLGPLTTTFTPPSNCLAFISRYRGVGCSNGIDVDTASCWPSASVNAPTYDFKGWGFYSPGTVCPSGYVSACTAELAGIKSSLTSDLPANFTFVFPLVPGETAVGCCPSGFLCDHYDGFSQSCTSSITSGTFLTGTCPSITDEGNTETPTNLRNITIPSTELDSETVTLEAFSTLDSATFTYESNSVFTYTASLLPQTLYAPLYQINWQASDRSTTTTVASSSSSIISTSSTTSSAATTAAAAGLSTGSKAAIGIVVPVAVIGLAAALGFWLLRHRRRNQEMPAEMIPMAPNPQQRGPESVLYSDAGHLRLGTPSKQEEVGGPRPELNGMALR